MTIRDQYRPKPDKSVRPVSEGASRQRPVVKKRNAKTKRRKA